MEFETTLKGGYAMKKTVRIGYLKEYGNVYCRIEFEKGKLSISGVMGPMRNGDCRGGCGQIDMEFAHRNPADNDSRHSNPIKPEDITFAPGWDAELWYDFLDTWKHWHLNDMKAGCELQILELLLALDIVRQSLVVQGETRFLDLFRHEFAECGKAHALTGKLNRGKPSPASEQSRS